jgi:hypothetical protein
MEEDAVDHCGEKLAGHFEVGFQDLVKILKGVLEP